MGNRVLAEAPVPDFGRPSGEGEGEERERGAQAPAGARPGYCETLGRCAMDKTVLRAPGTGHLADRIRGDLERLVDRRLRAGRRPAAARGS